MSRPKRHRDAGSGQFVSPGFAADHPATTVSERIAPPAEPEIVFKKGDRIAHAALGSTDALGKATVVSGKLGPHGELKVRPDDPHHSGRKIVEVMARRCIRLDEAAK